MFFLFAAFCLYFVHTGINDYKEQIDRKAKFSEIERLKVNQYATYGQYGTYGIRLLYLPSPLSIFFINSSVISELTAKVDSGEILHIYNSFKGQALFSEKLGGFKDFSGIIQLFGSLLVLYFGFEAFLHQDYIRFLSGLVGVRRLFFSIFLSRLILLMLFFLFIAVGAVSWMRISGIRFGENEMRLFSLFFLVMILMLVFFFVMGCVAGTLKSRYGGILMVILSWFVFVFLIPGTVRAVISDRADNITPTYNLELEKLEALMSFEQKARRRYGNFTDKKARSTELRKSIESFWDNEFKQILASERNMAAEMGKHIQFFYQLSMVFPTTFYLSTGNEVSSKGYGNYLDFYSFILDLKERFVRYFLDKRYYSNDSEVVAFLKKDENIFHARGRLSGNFLFGILLNFLYALALMVFSFKQFNRSLLK